MARATKYSNWQHMPMLHPELWGVGESPCIDALQRYLMPKFGGMDLGSYGKRTVRGGQAPSTHGYGAAWDWRYVNADGTGLLGRAKMLANVMPLLTDHSLELGVQLIVDYIGCRSWNASRSGDAAGGWRPGVPDMYGMGKAWAGWLHIEVHPDAWHDARSVEVKLGTAHPTTGQPAVPPFDPAHGQFSLYPFAPNKPTLRIGAKGDPVGYLQGVLKKNGYGVVVDNDFGAQTDHLVRDYQQQRHLTVDGVVGPKTWAMIDADARR